MSADRIDGAAVAAAFGASALLAAAGVWRALAFAKARALLDHPSERSSHSVPTPRGGGLGIVASLAACLCGLAWIRSDVAFAAPLVPVALACAVGFADDRKAMAPWPKMLLLLAAAATALPFATVRSVQVPYAGAVDLGLLAIPLSLFWLTGFSNAFNFMDGINGISGLTALVSGLGFAVAGLFAGDAQTAFLGALVAGSAAGFLPWNFPRARIFMGDSGSLPLGMLLAILAVGASQPASPGSEAALPFPATVLLLGPYVFDVAFTLVRRAREGKNLGQAHNEHLYQRLARGLGGHAPSALVFAGLTAATSGLALLYRGWGDLGRVLSLLIPLGCLLASTGFVFRLESTSESRRAAPRAP